MFVSIRLILFSIVFHLVNVCFAQPGWMLTNLSMPDANMSVIPVGDLGYILQDNSSFKVKNFVTGSLTDLAAYPHTGINNNLVYWFVQGDNIFIGYNTANAVSYFDCYSISNNTWTTKTAAPAVGFNLRLFFQTENYFYQKLASSANINRYDPGTDTWTLLTLPTVLGAWKSAYSYNGTGRLIQDNNDVWELNELDNSWSMVIDWTGSSQSSGNSTEMVVFNDTLLLNSQNGNTLFIHSLNTSGFSNAPSYSPCWEMWLWNNEAYATFGAVTRKFTNTGCTTSADITITPSSGIFFRGSLNYLTSTEVYHPAANGSAFTTSVWEVDGDILPAPYAGFYFDDTTLTHNLVRKVFSPYCTLSDTATLNIIEGNWNPILEMPIGAASRSEAIGFGCDQFAYVGLGYNNQDTLSDLWRMNYDTREINRVGEFPGGSRFGSAYLTYNNKGYLIGGKDSSNTSKNDFWQFNPQDESWTMLADFPNPLYGGVVFEANGFLYAGIGGTNTIYKYNFNSNSWSESSTFPGLITTRFPVVYQHNDLTYVGLGNSQHKLYSFDPNTNIWTLETSNFVPNLSGGSWVHDFDEFIVVGSEMSNDLSASWIYVPETGENRFGPSGWCNDSERCEFKRSHPAVFSHGDRKYLAFGKNSEYPDESESSYLTTSSMYGRLITEYKPDNCGTDSEIALMNKESMVNLPVVFYGVNWWYSNIDRTIIVGPYSFENTTEILIPDAGYYPVLSIAEYAGCRDTFRCDVQIVCNATRDSLSTFDGQKRIGQATWALNGKFYLGPGIYAGGDPNTLYSYDSLTNTWSQLATFPGGQRTQAATFIIGNNLYLFGGINDYPWEYTGAKYSDLWTYSIETNTWTQLASNTIGLSGCFAYVYNGQAYIGGGLSSSVGVFENEVYKYDPQSNTWSLSSVFPMPGGINNASVVLQNDTAYVVGGYGYDSQCPSCKDNPSYSTYAYDHVNNAWFLHGPGPNELLYNYGINSFYNSGERQPAAIHNGRVYLAGRYDLFSYHLTTRSWSYAGKISNVATCASNFLTCEFINGGAQSGDLLYIFTKDKPAENTGQVNLHRLRALNLSDIDCGASQIPTADCICDLNNDGQVSTLDLLMIIENFGCSGSCMGDVNGDFMVNPSDINIFMGELGVFCE